ncbi:MAG: hypothetical protein HGGPFJEG_00752 [Ignavibacteria bacterium]|nr:hypothetical protein [Ignavibacteria bacterium]
MSVLKRRDIRIKVMQVLYAQLLSGDPIDKVKKDLLSDIPEKENKEFANVLIKSIIDNEKLIDDYILEKVKNWEMERISLLDKIIMKIGLAELLYFPDIPPKVSINEAIDIAKEYCTKNSGRFVNGILDAIHDDLKKEKLLNKSGRGLVNSKKKNNSNNLHPEDNHKSN